MMKNKKLLSLLLCIMMLVTFIPTQALAISNEDTRQRKEFIDGVEDNGKLVFKVFEVKNESKRRQRRSLVEEEPQENLDGLDISGNLHGEAVASAPTITQKVNVSLDAKGLNYGEQAFSNDLIQNGLKVKLYFKATGQDDTPVASKEITVQKSGNVETELDIPSGISTGVLYAEIQNPDDNVNIRIVKGADDTSETNTVSIDRPWEFTFEVMEIVHPVIKLVAKDPYGQDIQVTDNLGVKFNNGSLEVPFNLSSANSSYNIKNDAMFGETGEGDINDLNAYDKNNKPTLTVDNETGNETDGYKVTLGGLEYKVEKTYDYTKGGTITLTSQPDAIVPPTKPGSTDPVDLPTDGSYVRLTFNANEKVDLGKTGITGKFINQGTYNGQQKSYIDVKSGTKYDNAKLQELIGELKVEGTKQEQQNTKEPWDPKVPTGANDAVSEKTYYAKYIKTADKIKALGGLKGVDFAAWKGTSTAGKFWNKGIAPADSITDAANKKTVQDAIDAATVTDTSTPARTTDTTGEKPGTLKVTFADGSVYVVDASKQDTDPAKTNISQTLYVYEKGTTKPDPQPGGKETPVPDGTIFVEFTRDTTSIKEEGFKNLKPLMYAVGDTVDSTKFPDAKEADGYKTVIWTPAQTTQLKTTETAYNAQTKTFTFKASATKIGKTAKPNITAPKAGDKTISGTGVPGAKVSLTKEDKGGTGQGSPIAKDVLVDNNGKWTAKVPDGVTLNEGDIVYATQKEDGKDESDQAHATVKGKVTPPSYNYLPLTLDENYAGGRVRDYHVLVGEPIDAYLYTPHRRGYVFEGWSYNSRYLDEVRPGDRVYYPTTLYAIWSKQKAKDDEEVEPIDTRETHEHKAYMFGYPDGTVRPNGKITRAEAAALITRLLGIDALGSDSKPNFPDVPSSWYNKAINAAVQRGIMKGYPDGTFRPNAPITRAEFTQMIWTIDNKPYGIAPFADVIGHWAERPIGSEYQAGRIMGYPDGTFRPDAYITRAEAVVILNKIFDRNYDAISAMNCPTRGNIKFFIDLDASFWGYYDMVEATNDHSFKRRVKGAVQEDWVEVK